MRWEKMCREKLDTEDLSPDRYGENRIANSFISEVPQVFSARLETQPPFCLTRSMGRLQRRGS